MKLAAMALASFVGYASATPYVQYQAFDEHTRNVYLNGVGTGYMIANLEMIDRHQKPLFCPPSDLPMGPPTFTAFVEGEVSTATVEQKKGSVEYFLLRGLKRAFPCSATP